MLTATFNLQLSTCIIYRMLSIVIQAGGQSTRMGEDKAIKPFLGRPLIQRVIDRLTPIADEILVTTNRPDDYAFLGLRLAPDLVAGRGALGGLYTALAAATSPLVAVAACDMPFASASLLETAARLLVQEEADVVIAKSEEGYEPFHAVYRRKTCLPAIQSAIEADKWKVIAWFPSVKVRELSTEEVARFDPSGLCFWNVNTPEDFAEAERLATTR
jgi:molybdopterin-guanine dinucleotide biosynthesis protein A